MGGGASIVSSLYYQDIFAAAYATGSYFIPKYLPKEYDTPLVVFHGVQDADAPVELIRQTVSTLKKAGAPVHYKEFEQYGHNCPAEFFYPDLMWNWLYSQSKPRLR